MTPATIAALALAASTVFGPTAPETPARAGNCGHDHARHRLAMCWPNNLTPEQWQRIVEENDALPPTQVLTGERFFTDVTVWVGDLTQQPSGRAMPARFTYSFPDDGVTWGLPEISTTGPNDLNAQLIAAFGDLDLGREYIRSGLASWRRFSKLQYDEVPDDNSPEDADPMRIPTRGDVRIGGLEFGGVSFLAYNAFPSAEGLVDVGGSDMCINTSYFVADAFSDPTTSYRYFRNTIAHEHGHGLGCIHPVPCDQTKLMEPVISVAFDAVQADELRNIGRNYGDRLAGNHSSADAHDFGDLTAPIMHSVIEKNLSTNGVDGFGNTDEDWFRFTLSNPQPVQITVNPTGPVGANRPQISGCLLLISPLVEANKAGDLSVELYADDGVTLIASAAEGGPGVAELLNAGVLAAGSYRVRVVDIGPNPPSNQIVQLYDLTIRVANAKAPPLVIAGLNKRVAAGQTCYFLGLPNSLPTESGTGFRTIRWDLDGDGAYETFGPTPTTTYVSNGVYPVTLQITDTNNMDGEDTITVTVFGATTTLEPLVPADQPRGQTSPIVVRGTNLKNVASAMEFSVSGTGVVVGGTPVANTLGTEVTGLTLQVAADAPLGARDLSISNADGSATRLGALNVVNATGCVGDLNGDNVVDLGDLATMFGCWTQPCGDIDGDGTTGTSDLGILFANWRCGL